MSAEYREIRQEEYEAAVQMEGGAFYNRATPERLQAIMSFYPPKWTVAAFVDGRPVADVRTLPMARWTLGAALRFGAVGPVACDSAYRRQGHVGTLLRLALERMREHGQGLSGLHTPHDALYARYGWERAEGKKRYEFRPKDVRLRIKGARGTLEKVSPDDWPRLDAIYRAHAEPRNGPLLRIEPWWKESILRDYEQPGEPAPREAYVWRSAAGQDEGFVVYMPRRMPRDGWWEPTDVFVRDFISLSGDAYLGLWEHLLNNDIARTIIARVALHDPLPDLTEDPFRIAAGKDEGAMIRIVDVERALNERPYCGERHAAFTMRVNDRTAPWNEGTWRVEAAEGHMQATRTEGEPDVELTANTLAPLFTGYMRPDVAAGVGLLKVARPEAVAEMTEAFRVTHPPYCNDRY